MPSKRCHCSPLWNQWSHSPAGIVIRVFSVLSCAGYAVYTGKTRNLCGGNRILGTKQMCRFCRACQAKSSTSSLRPEYNSYSGLVDSRERIGDDEDRTAVTADCLREKKPCFSSLSRPAAGNTPHLGAGGLDNAFGYADWLHKSASIFGTASRSARTTAPAAPVADHWIDDRDPNISSDPPTDAAWWQTFNDPVLDCLVQTAYHQNLSLRSPACGFWRPVPSGRSSSGNLFPQSQQAFGDYTRTNLSKKCPQRHRR